MNKTQLPKPFIFSKKINSSYNVIPLNIPNNTLGPNRHFPAATKEWDNSIYTYNNNHLKNLTSADKSLAILIKSYFNLYFNKKVLQLERIPIRFRRSSFNKIFVGKAELKHTNNKVIINLNVFNQQKINLIRNINLLYNKIISVTNYTSKFNKNTPVNIWTKLGIYDKTIDPSLVKYLEGLSDKMHDEIKLERSLNVTRKKSKESEIQQMELLLEKINNLLFILKDASVNTYECNKLFTKVLRKTLLEDELENISKYKLLLDLNRSKFEHNFIIKLKEIIKKIYNKEIELNVVNLNSLYLDMSIFTDAIARKLKDRDNNILKTFKTALLMVKVPYINPIKEKYGKSSTNQVWLNKVQALRLNSLIVKYKNSKDILNKILHSIIPNPIASKKDLTNKNILDTVYKSIKYRNLRGVRLEARGRLTRRFTASRTIFKVKWKGGLKNIDSSYRGLSSTILRGHAKSNVQYHTSVNRNRIGAYGIKGWIAGR